MIAFPGRTSETVGRSVAQSLGWLVIRSSLRQETRTALPMRFPILSLDFPLVCLSLSVYVASFLMPASQKSAHVSSGTSEGESESPMCLPVRRGKVTSRPSGRPNWLSKEIPLQLGRVLTSKNKTNLL